MRISVVINNYNYEEFLSLAIDSALTQTWPDTEVIVIDDASTDGSAAIIEFYANRPTRPVIPLVKSVNGGQAAAFNTAMDHVTGDAVIFLDADDLLYPQTTAHAAKAFSTNPDLARVQWTLHTIDGRGRPCAAVRPASSMMPSGDLRHHLIRYRTHVWPPTSGNAFSISVLRKILPMPVDYTSGADLYLAELSAMCGSIRSLNDPGGAYRLHSRNKYARRDPNAAYLRHKIETTTRTHEHVRKLGAELGLDVPEDPRSALDAAFACQRLGSLRLDAANHPFTDDRRWKLAVSGSYATIRHPHLTSAHKAKRLAWIAGVAFGPKRYTQRLIRRFYGQ